MATKKNETKRATVTLSGTFPLAATSDDRETHGSNACACGCGGDANPGARFLPGHDSKLRSNVLGVERGEVKLKDLKPAEQKAVRAELNAAHAGKLKRA